MKKLLLATFVLAIAMVSCEKDVNSVSTESKFIGKWEAQRYEDSYEYGVLNSEDTTIRIVEESEFESYSADPEELILDFTSDSLFVLFFGEDDFGEDDFDEAEMYAWTYGDNTLYLEYIYEDSTDFVELQVETLSNTSLVVSYHEYESYNDGGAIYYEEYEEKIYFEKINSEEGRLAANRLIKDDKSSFFQGLRKRRIRKH